ncbi:lipoprotein 17-related variable surface protein [Mycoplasmopsis primatum]|uniref:lipoprotein 17-related variable surface protein n=1 Tax=Mycoplasmopsis primatum TaxID=55604 RepID=UPI00049705B5|nr:lipoprotein 17-related variable surface protein [Mycoplasmopsis primatum]
MKPKKSLWTLNLLAIAPALIPAGLISAGCSSSKISHIKSVDLSFKSPELFTKTEITKNGIQKLIDHLKQNHANGYSIKFINFVKNADKTAEDRQKLKVEFDIYKDGMLVLKKASWTIKNLKDYKKKWTSNELERLYKSIKNKNNLVALADKNVLPSQAIFKINNLFENKDPKIKLSIAERKNNDLEGKIYLKLLMSNEDDSNPFTINELIEFTGFKKSSGQNNNTHNDNNKKIDLNKIASELTPADLEFKDQNFILPSKYDLDAISIDNNSPFKSKYPNIEIVVSNSDDNDQEGIAEISFKLRDTKNPQNISKSHKLAISGFMSLNKLNTLAQRIQTSDLNISNSKQLLPSKYNKEIELQKNSTILLENPNVRIVIIEQTNDDVNGIKILQIKLLDEKNQIESTTNSTLNIDNFYSKTKFESLLNNISADDIDITPNANEFASLPNNLNFKANSSLIQLNNNMKLVPKDVEIDDNNGIVKFNVELYDTLNEISTSSKKSITIEGFFNKNEFTKLAKNISFEHLSFGVDKSNLPNYYLIKNLKLKDNAPIIQKFSNAKISMPTTQISQNSNTKLSIFNEFNNFRVEDINVNLYKNIFTNDIENVIKSLTINDFVINNWKNGSKLPEKYKNNDILLKNEILNKYLSLTVTSKYINKDAQNDNTARIEFLFENKQNNISIKKQFDFPWFFSAQKYNSLVKLINQDNIILPDYLHEFHSQSSIRLHGSLLKQEYPNSVLYASIKNIEKGETFFNWRYRDTYTYTVEIYIIDEISTYISNLKIYCVIYFMEYIKDEPVRYKRISSFEVR